MDKNSGFEEAFRSMAQVTERALDRLIPEIDGPESRVIEAMRSSALGGGKRLRPCLVMAGADIFDVARSCSERVAAAVEMVHNY